VAGRRRQRQTALQGRLASRRFSGPLGRCDSGLDVFSRPAFRILDAAAKRQGRRLCPSREFVCALSLPCARLSHRSVGRSCLRCLLHLPRPRSSAFVDRCCAVWCCPLAPALTLPFPSSLAHGRLPLIDRCCAAWCCPLAPAMNCLPHASPAHGHLPLSDRCCAAWCYPLAPALTLHSSCVPLPTIVFLWLIGVVLPGAAHLRQLCVLLLLHPLPLAPLAPSSPLSMCFVPYARCFQMLCVCPRLLAAVLPSCLVPAPLAPAPPRVRSPCVHASPSSPSAPERFCAPAAALFM
jgi:hypothetical protein